MPPGDNKVLKDKEPGTIIIIIDMIKYGFSQMFMPLAWNFCI